MRVAYYSPLPPERSGIADYSALLLPELERRIEVAVARRGARRPVPADIALYHVGNNPEHHWWIVDALRRRPGVVVLHDFVLHHLVAGMTLGAGRPEEYLDAMQREAGALGRMLAHGVIDGLVPPIWETRPHEFPLTGEVLAPASGVIVHSRYVERLVREYGYAGSVWRIPMAWPAPAEVAPADLPSGRVVVASFGYLNATKRLPQLLEAFALLRDRVPEALLLLVGGLSPGLALDLPEHAIRFDYVPDQQLWSLLAAADVCVSLRFPTMGETSAVVVRALSLGTPLVVSDVGWFAELPDEAAVKVPVGGDEVEVLALELERLALDPERRRALGAAGRAYAEREHDLGRVADAYTAAIEEAAGGEAVRGAVRAEIARAATEIGMPPEGEALGEVAARLREVERGR